MSKLATMLIVPLLGGTAAVVAWNLSLQDDLDSLRSEVAAIRDAEPETAAAPAATRSRSAAKAEPMLRDLAQRLHVVEQQTANAAPGAKSLVSAGAAGEGEAEGEQIKPEDLPSVYRTSEFTAAVEGVLDSREQRRRKERLEKQSERMAQSVLRDLEVSDGQRADFQRLTLDYLLRRDELRRDSQTSEEERRARTETLDQERQSSLSALFDDTQLESIQKRMRRFGGMRGGVGSRLRAPDSADRPQKRRPGKRQKRRPRGNDDS